MAARNVTELPNKEELTDPDYLIREAWKDAGNIKEPYSRLQTRIKLISISIQFQYGIDMILAEDAEDVEDEGEE